MTPKYRDEDAELFTLFATHGIKSSSPTELSSRMEDPLREFEWWYIFLLQFMLWWSTWSMVEWVNEILLNRHTYPGGQVTMFLLDVVLGALIYLFPHRSFVEFGKLKCFFGLVFVCCGIWGILDHLTEFISTHLGFPRGVVFVSSLFVAGALGTVHHFKCRPNYLIERLL
jgi:hypothetical protein